MPWHPDIPDLPDLALEKPHALERLEKLPPESLNAMTQVETEERIRDAANGIVTAYSKNRGSKANYEECVYLVSAALAQTGEALPGNVGKTLVGRSEIAAEEACKLIFPNEFGINEPEY